MRRFGELEAVIMDRLWEQGRPMLVREMVENLRRDRPLAYTTVMTVMENLHRKGWLRREGEGRAWRDEPAGAPSGDTAALMTDPLAPRSDPRTALAPFVPHMSPRAPPPLGGAAAPGPAVWGRRRAAGGRGRGPAGPAGRAGHVEPARGAVVGEPPRPAAYGVAGRCPPVIVPAGAVAALAPGQLDAVLAHERAHLAGRHHALKAAARIGRQVLPFLPLLRDSEAQVARLAELHADDAATRTADPRELATALVVLATPGHPTPAPAFGAAATAAAQRIHRLLGPPEPPSRPRQHLLRATTALLALPPVLVALAPAVAAPARRRVPAA